MTDVAKRLCIADPPYLGRGASLYGTGANGREYFHSGTGSYFTQGRKPTKVLTTEHNNAHEWDRPERHKQLIADLENQYDGWAVALALDSLPLYLAAAPKAHVAVWVKPNAIPGGAHILTTWEPVLIRVPDGRKRQHGRGQVRDVLTASAPQKGHIGAKPAAWTRWVLDMLAYNQNTDTVIDMFAGSGAVSAEINQQVIDL